MKATALLMALCLALTALAGGGGDSLTRLRWGALSPVLLEAGQWWRVYTSTLLHSDWWSLAFVLNSLGWLGWWLEPRYRSLGLLDLFSLAGVAGALAALQWPVGPSLGAVAPAFAFLTAGLLCLKEQRAVVLGLLLLNAAVAWKLRWNPACIGAGVVSGLLWELGLRRLPKGALTVPMVLAWAWSLTWFVSYKDVSSYPTRLYKEPRFQVEHSVLLQPGKPSDDGRVFVFTGLGFEIGLAFLTEPNQSSVREFGSGHGGSVPQEMKVEREREEIVNDRVWLRLELAPRRAGQEGASKGIMLVTAQGRQRIHLGLLLGARRSEEQVLPLLTTMQRTLAFSVPAAQVRAQRAYEDAMGARKEGKREEAVAALGAVLKEQPALVDALIARGYLLNELGRPREAEADFTAAEQAAPLDPRSYLNRALLRINEGNFAAARPDLEKALKLAEAGGTRFEALNARGWCKAHQGDPAGALVDADAALALNPPPDLKALALDTRGFALEGLKRYPEALKDYAEAQKEKVPDAYLHAGELFWKLGRKAEGRAALEEFLKLAPARPETGRVKARLAR